MIQLVRAWDPRYTPSATNGVVRLRRASAFRDIKAGEGIADPDEGQRRLTVEGSVRSQSDHDQHGRHLLPDIPINIQMHHGDQVIDLEDVRPGETRTYPYVIDVHDDSRWEPYILCFSLIPHDIFQWQQLVESLAGDDSVWTITTDISRLKLEIECGVKHWIAVNRIKSHRLRAVWGKVEYIAEDKPVPQTPEQLLDFSDMVIGRWFRKVNKYVYQREYRFAFIIESDEIPGLPPYIDIELTKSGIALFQSYDLP